MTGIGDRHQQAEGRAATAEIRRLDDVAGERSEHEPVEDPARVSVAPDGEQARAVDLPELSRDIDDHDHHQQHDRRDPKEREADFGVGAGIRCRWRKDRRQRRR